MADDFSLLMVIHQLSVQAESLSKANGAVRKEKERKTKEEMDGWEKKGY